MQKYRNITSKSIKLWPDNEKPREKLLKNGAHLLNDSELLAILLGTGIKGENVLNLSRRIIQKFKTFKNMSNTDLKDWQEFRGLGKAKISILKAAFEIARRFNELQENNKKSIIKCTQDIVQIFQARMRDLRNEVLKVVLLNPKNIIIDTIEISKGTPTGANPVIREIIAKAIQKFASGIICIHNHPSGDPAPSKDDEIFTKLLKDTMVPLDLKLFDHIIFGEDQYYSFDKGITENYI